MSVLTGGDRQAILAILDSIGAPITLTDLHKDGEFRVFMMNRHAEEFYGVKASDVVGLSLRQMGLRPEGRLERIESRFRECIASGAPVHFRDHSPVDTRRGDRRWVNITMTPLVDETQGITRIMSTLIDVTELRRYEEELADALAKVLSGFVSICAACKKIEDRGEWTPVEGYITRRSDARFTHGMCPQCFETWYGQEAET